MDKYIELSQVLKLMSLMIRQKFSSGEILQIFIVYDNINRCFRIFQVMILIIEYLINSEELLIIYIIIKFRYYKYMRKESNRIKFPINEEDK